MDNYKDVLPFWAFVTFLNLSIIYYFVIRNKIFTPMTERKKKSIIKSLFYICFFLIFFVFSGWHRPWMYPEELSNLQKEEGILQITHYNKGNHAYLENGGSHVIELVCLFSLSRLSNYENENVIIWRKGKYVYQMEVHGDMVFSINEANSGLFKYNLEGVFLDLFILSGMLLFMFLCVSVEG